MQGRALFVLALVLGFGCGNVVKKQPDAATTAGSANGVPCTAGTQCQSGICSTDGVCCDTACSGACEACVAGKTGGVDGTCSPISAGTDPDHECPSSITCSMGTLLGMTCNGAGACAAGGSGTTCNGYACADATTCLTTCNTNNDCTADNFCNSNHACAKRLKIALVAGAGSCLTAAGGLYFTVQSQLQSRGHTATIVLDTDIDTPAEISAYDVVILAGPGNGCTNPGWTTYDAVLPAYVQGGGGLVAAGWTLFNGPPQNLLSLMPNSGSAYLGASTVAPVAGSIMNGLGTFMDNQYLPYGGGTPKPGAIPFQQSGATACSWGWQVGSGRSVFLGPLYFEAPVTYQNQNLTDGSQPASLESMFRAIEWAGRSL